MLLVLIQGLQSQIPTCLPTSLYSAMVHRYSIFMMEIKRFDTLWLGQDFVLIGLAMRLSEMLAIKHYRQPT